MTTKGVFTLNRAQVVALCSLAMELGPQCEFEFQAQYLSGDVLVCGVTPHGSFKFTLPPEGGSKPAPATRTEGA